MSRNAITPSPYLCAEGRPYGAHFCAQIQGSAHAPSGATPDNRSGPTIDAAYTSSVCSQFVSVPLALLGLLEREPSHGYDLKRDYDAYFGRGKPLPFGQVYATLARLARDGKVRAGEVEPGAGPDRKRY